MDGKAEVIAGEENSRPTATILPFRRPGGAATQAPASRSDELLESMLQETMDMLLRTQTILRLNRMSRHRVK